MMLCTCEHLLLCCRLTTGRSPGWWRRFGVCSKRELPWLTTRAQMASGCIGSHAWSHQEVCRLTRLLELKPAGSPVPLTFFGVGLESLLNSNVLVVAFKVMYIVLM